MAIEKQLSVFVQNKVGSLGELCAGLSKANINIRAISITDDLEWGIVRLIVDNAEKAKDSPAQTRTHVRRGHRADFGVKK